MGKYKRYVVVTPPYSVTSGGIRVMYALRSWLEVKGQIVHLNEVPEGEDYIAIYPEIYHGNPAQSKHVVRYILNTPGVMGMGGVPGPTEFSKKDKLIVFSQIYNTVGVDDNHILFLPVLNLNLFKVTNTGKRKFKCKLVGKGIDLHLPETEGLFELNREWSEDQAALADYLNECEVMYSYDPNSAMFEVARLCGCKVCIIPSIYSKEEFSKYEPGMNGIAWGIEDKVDFDPEEFREHYQGMIETFSQKLDLFIGETQWMV